MSLLVVGSIAIDTVQTARGETVEALGGSASFFAYAASFLSPVRVVGIIGEDFPDEYHAIFTSRPNIDTTGVQRVDGKTFRWKGRYSKDMNTRETLELHLNVFGQYEPTIPEHYRDSKFIFLANASPVTQLKVLEQIEKPHLVVADTMDFWIETQRDELLKLFGRIDGLVMNDQEALMLTECDQIIPAGLEILKMGPRFIILKKGEHGALLFTAEGMVSLPAYPVSKLVDPTGAGDAFAGGMMGWLASSTQADHHTFKQALAYGTVIASILVEGFSLTRFQESAAEHVHERYQQFAKMLHIH